MKNLEPHQRMQLMKFVCSFAWADLEIQAEERAFIGKLVKRLALSEDEIAQVETWLEVPPKAEEVDPSDIPHAHRQLFVDAARATVAADGRVDQIEAENLALLEMLAR